MKINKNVLINAQEIIDIVREYKHRAHKDNMTLFTSKDFDKHDMQDNYDLGKHAGREMAFRLVINKIVKMNKIIIEEHYNEHK